MTHIIVHGCCNDASCVPVCPVDCIHPTPDEPGFAAAEQLYIDRRSCIDCGACLDECPADAVRTDLDLTPTDLPFTEINDLYFAHHPGPAAMRPRPPLRFVAGPLRVAIVGAGPAGCYAAAALLESSAARISMLDRLPTPHGLLRAGVAPDHQATKKVGNTFDSVLAHPSVTCHFNVTVGEDIGLDELLAHHDAVIWAAGAAGDRTLGIPGENLPGCHPAREFVGWYNSAPDLAAATFDLTGHTAVVIGNGNVGIDVARILVRDVAELARTDISGPALDGLRASAVREVVVAGRRGPRHAAYTLSELLALTQLNGVDVVTDPDEVTGLATDPALRIVQDCAAAAAAAAATRTVRLRYLLAPVTINGADRVESVTFERNEIVVDGSGTHIRPTGRTETVATGLVLTAVGYRGDPVPGLPFDAGSGTVPNVGGQVVDPVDGRAMPGLYCAGWIKRGPKGVIGTNKQCSRETVASLLDAMEHGPHRRSTDDTAFAALVEARKPEAIDVAGWSRIRAAEERRGSALGKPREKFATVSDLVGAAGRGRRTR